MITKLPTISDKTAVDLTVDIRQCTVVDRDRGSCTTFNLLRLPTSSDKTLRMLGMPCNASNFIVCGAKYALAGGSP